MVIGVEGLYWEVSIHYMLTLNTTEGKPKSCVNAHCCHNVLARYLNLTKPGKSSGSPRIVSFSAHGKCFIHVTILDNHNGPDLHNDLFTPHLGTWCIEIHP